MGMERCFELDWDGEDGGVGTDLVAQSGLEGDKGCGVSGGEIVAVVKLQTDSEMSRG